MNARMNELAIQAGGVWQGGYVEQANGDSVYTEHKFVHGGDMDVEQFVRLLVKECVLQCHHNDDMDRIEQHFGVTE